MKSETSTAPRTKKYLVSCLAALMAVSAPMGFAADNDALKKLQDENAALRKRLAALEGSSTQAAAPAAAAPASMAAKAPSLKADAGVETMSAFEIKSDKDQGYLRTNSVTATRINMAIQNIPISVSVMSKDFLDDSNIRSITDILRYSSSGSGDNRFAMARPSNSATPQGAFTLRGFPINSLLRNGVSRYIGYNVNNVDRVEIVKGPASVFFGAGYPGGVINYITKQPVFGKIPTTLSYTVGDNNVNRVLLDNNTQLSKKAAMRIVGSWENSSGARNFEYNKTNSLTANISFIPFDSGKVKLTAEVEAYDSKFNISQWDWIYPDGWFQAYAEPSAALISAAGLSTNANPVAAYRARIFAGPGNYMVDVRNAAGNQGLPLYTKIIDGAYYTDKSGKRIHDKGFNWTNRGSYSKQHVDTATFTVEAAPTSWMDARYVLTNENGVFDNKEGYIQPNADGRTFNAQAAANSSGYYRKVQNHQFDLIFKATKWGVKNTLLVGGVFIEQMQQYNAVAPNGLSYAQVPGATNPLGNPGVLPDGTGGSLAKLVSTGDVPVNQVIRDRFGVIKTVQQVFTQWDPGAEIAPDVNRIILFDRTAMDGYKTQDQSGYLNYNGSMLDDRLNVLAGVRREMHRDSGQYLTANFPWVSNPPYAFTDQKTWDPGFYNYSPSYAGGYDQFYRTAGTSYMGGLSYQIKKDVNIFTSYSKTFRINFGNAGGIGTIDLPYIWNAARTYLATQGKNSFSYDGKTIASESDLGAALSANGALTKVPNETGTNLEFGVKTSLWDNKLVGTFSVFRAERSNQRYDDSAKQLAEPLNYGNNLGIFGPVGTVGPDGVIRANSRVLRWRTTGLKNRIEGADFEAIYSPARNLQVVVNGAWMWTAKTLIEPTKPKPGTTAFNALSAAGKIDNEIFYNARIENVPEYRLNTNAKYTFTNGSLAGLAVGGAARYSSETVIARNRDWNPLAGGMMAGNFLVFDSTVSYPWEVLGYKISSSLGIYNLLDEKYFEGSFVSSPRRTWLLTSTLKF